jgi:uncharacterized protein YbjT (DUF2867 family)
MKTALILGATGLVGKEVLKQALEDPVYSRIKILVRSPQEIKHPRLEELVIDFRKLEQYENEFAVDHVYCCLGTTIKKAKTKEKFRLVDYEYPLLAARLSKGKADKFLVISAQGANPKSPFFYNKTKGKLEKDLIALNLPNLLIFRPSLLLGERKEPRPMEEIAGTIMKVINPLFQGPLKKYAAKNASYVAECMISAAKGIFLFEDLEMLRFPPN